MSQQEDQKDQLPVTQPESQSEPEQMQDETEQTETYKKLFTLRYRIPQEEYLQFNRIMSAPALKKGKRNSLIMGSVEVFFGIAFFYSVMTSGETQHFAFYLLALALVLMGLYALTYYRFFYEKALRKSVAKSYAAIPYLQQEITVEFYPNKFTELIKEKRADTFWHTILEIRENDSLYLIMLQESRCLLIPKGQITTNRKQLERLLDEVCTNFEKPRVML